MALLRSITKALQARRAPKAAPTHHPPGGKAPASSNREPTGRRLRRPSSFATSHPRLSTGLGLALVVAVVATLTGAGVLRPLDDALSQLRFRSLERPPSGSLTVVEIDVPSLRAAQTWPWSRDRYAKAIDNLLAAGAEVVAFDVDFSARSSDDADRALAASIAARPGTVVLPTFVQSVGRNGDRRLEGTRPLAGLAENALIASVNVPVDADGMVRRYQRQFGEGAEARASMAAILAGAPPATSGPFLIDYGIRVADIDRLSFEAAYAGGFDPALVRGRKVLIGATALELGDEFITPKGTLPGVYVHALAYESLQAERGMLELKPAILVALAALAAVFLRPRPGVNLARILRRHLGVAGVALALPVAVQALAPVSIDASPVLLAQMLCLIWITRAELQRRAQAVVKAREAHLLQLAGHLRKSRNRIRAANAKLTTANEALDRALTAKTEFLAATSHEVRTPLNAILGMTQVMLADRTVVGPLREKVDAVHSAGEALQALASDILDVAQIETGELTVTPSEIDLGKLLADTTRTWSARAEARGLAFDADLDGAPLQIIEDPIRLRQVLANLLGNAVKFTERGRVGLKAHVVDGPQEQLVIEVADTGIGIAEDQQELIFEPFRQADSGLTRNYEGAGLGLTIARQLARAMGGEVLVRSRDGAGSTFTLRLPLIRLQTEPQAREGAEAAESLRTSTVLLLDANPLFQRVTKAGLVDQVASLETAASVAEARTALAQRRFDLLVADGATLLRDAETAPAALGDLATSTGGARISILWAGPADEIQGLMAAGAHHVACKPITMDDLISQLTELYGTPPTKGTHPEISPAA